MRTEDKKYPALEDTDLMTFGKHKGEPLSDVPAYYIRWLWQETDLKNYVGKPIPDFKLVTAGMIAEKIKLANYVWNSKEAIEQELGDLSLD
jgi:hypothetical protein